LIQGKTKDNPFLAEGYIESLLQDYTQAQCEAYLNGEFVNFNSNTVYYSYDPDLNDTDVTLSDYPKEPLHIGMDFNIGKMAAVVHIVKDGKIYAVDEIVNEKDTYSIAATIKARYAGRKIFIYPDASAKMEHKILSKSGFKVIPPGKGNPLIKDRVTTMNTRFCNAQGHRAYLVNKDQCPVYSNGLMQQAYDKFGKPDKSNDIDHCLDAGGYCVFVIAPIKAKATMRIR
jgi:hypothetical protein